jgi:hypothetical protein
MTLQNIALGWGYLFYEHRREDYIIQLDKKPFHQNSAIVFHCTYLAMKELHLLGRIKAIYSVFIPIIKLYTISWVTHSQSLED